MFAGMGILERRSISLVSVSSIDESNNFLRICMWHAGFPSYSDITTNEIRLFQCNRRGEKETEVHQIVLEKSSGKSSTSL